MSKRKLFTIAAIVAALAILGGLFGYRYYLQHQAAGQVIEVNEQNFDKEVMQSKLPVFIEVYLPSCAPCQKQAPLVEQAAKDYAGKVKFVKIDAGANPNLAGSLNISVVPTMMVVKLDEKTLLVAEGFLDAAKLKKFIEDGLAAKKNP
ncbi:MAG TPA: thioredoxin domain-containing protein [Candidatus Acidoferrales bacterium]|nr:thioredoxin domain-containing protein [Candidatus Acidoferrales bacterium]